MSFKNVLKIFLIVSVFLFVGSNVKAETFGWCEGGNLPADSPRIANLIIGTKFNVPNRAEILKITAPIDFTGSGQLVKVGIYGNAENFIVETLPVASTGNDPETYYDFTFSENPILLSGNYWLVVWGNDVWSGAWARVKTQTTDGLYEKSATYNGFPLSFADADYVEERSLAICGTYNIVEGDILTIPSNFLALTTSFIDDLFTDLNLVVILAIGLPLGFWVIKKIISLV